MKMVMAQRIDIFDMRTDPSPRPALRNKKANLSRTELEELERAQLIREGEISRELTRTLKTLRDGSIVLTVHGGRLVEISKTNVVRERDLGAAKEL